MLNTKVKRLEQLNKLKEDRLQDMKYELINDFKMHRLTNRRYYLG